MSTKVCAYSTSDNAYAVKAIVSLLSIRKQNPNIDLFLFGHRYSSTIKEIALAHDIRLLELDLSNIFTRTWEYPVECYYLFAAPEILYEQGYTHSIYIDGDVYCNKDPLVFIEEVKEFAGVSNGSIKQVLGKDFEMTRNLWPRLHEDKLRLQTGVLYFNNQSMKKLAFFNKIGALFNQAIQLKIPRKGDDSLFALFQWIYDDFIYRDSPKWFNYIENGIKSKPKTWFLTRDSAIRKKVVFYHFTENIPKPWEPDNPSHSKASLYFSGRWQEIAQKELSDNELRQYLPEFTS